MEILISDRQGLALDKDLIVELSDFVLIKEKVDQQSEVSISIVEPTEMAYLNKRYRDLDKPTDVLSFSLREEPPLSHLLGDIVLCPIEARKKAALHQLSFDEYFALLIVHANLHLIGYGHESDRDAKVMTEKEEQLLTNFNLADRSFE